ncbi:hypothetical protein ACU6T4_08045 [Avibacterium paragallinarum]|uniref:hypothetical protein n=1 Tax=Avibacterium paragallinarum TaxID=728 RepID=UPI0018F5865D|nr:hypothetical protein [Avibacterium paragallinarum]
MMKLISKSIFVIVSSLMLSACVTQRMADFTLASTKNVNLSSGKLVLGERVKGEDQSSGIAYLKNAVDRAIEKDRCAVALSDVVISLEPGFFSVKFIAEGTQVIDRSLPGCDTRR